MHVQQAVILVGGFGTRLGNLTKSNPKPLLPVSGKPFVEYIMAHVAKFGIREIILLAGYLGDQVKELYEGHHIGEARIKVIVEPEPLGTAGALKFAQPYLQDLFYVLNGDTFFDVELQDLPQHLNSQAWSGILALHTVGNAQRYGTVEIQPDFCIQAFIEKKQQAEARQGYINGGIYLLRKEILSFIQSLPSSLEKDIFPLLVEQRKLFGKPYDGYFIDIGLPSTLQQAQDEFVGKFDYHFKIMT